VSATNDPIKYPLEIVRQSNGYQTNTGETILVIEDYEGLKSILNSQVINKSYNLYSAHLSTDAISIARDLQPRLAVIDLSLMAGDPHLIMWFIRRVAPKCYLVAIAKVDTPEIRSKAMEAGAHQIVLQSDQDHLLKLIDNLFSD